MTTARGQCMLSTIWKFYTRLTWKLAILIWILTGLLMANCRMMYYRDRVSMYMDLRLT